MATPDSSTSAAAGPHLPPGFRFHPTDEELLVHYLKNKAQSTPLPVPIIAELDLYKFDPWELPAKAAFGEQEWYFFSPRSRKYPNGARPNRAATSGYWKATGTDKAVMMSGGSQKVGVKKALVFYRGKPPRGVKTGWIMHEYRLFDGNKPRGYDPVNINRGSLQLDDWVLCRIYKKNTVRPVVDEDRGNWMDYVTMTKAADQQQYLVGPALTGQIQTGTVSPLAGSSGHGRMESVGPTMADHGSSSGSFSGLLSQMQWPAGGPYDFSGLNSWYP